jgi:propane monooxygenase reductase subunit
MHGCKEGQCASCKSLLIEGDLEMEKYSTFALADYEREQGYVLLCRSHAYSDLTVELLNYDEETILSGLPVQTVQTVVSAIEPLTHDIKHLVLQLVEPRELRFRAGQYVDIRIPGSEEHRSYSMANTPATNSHLEFILKVFPGGRFSSLLDESFVGTALEVTGPYGSCILRENSERDVVLIGGGAGMAPLWSLLNDIAARGLQRRVTFYYGARSRRDLFYLDKIDELRARLPEFRFIPALSEPLPQDHWQGETGLITEVVARTLSAGSEVDVYLCGPAAMIDAALPLLVRKGIREERMLFDKFTPTGTAE